MNSIDRKLARCAREIEAARPKGLTVEEFEAVDLRVIPYGKDGGCVILSEADCRQIKGAPQVLRSESVQAAGATAQHSPVGAPPLSVPEAATEKPKFKVGDRIRSIRQGYTGTVKKIAGIAESLWPIHCDMEEGFGDARFDPYEIELLPPIAPTPASSEWVEHKPGDPSPVSSETLIDYKWEGRGDEVFGHGFPAGGISFSGVTAYRVVKQP